MNKKIAFGIVYEVPNDMRMALTSDIDILMKWNNLTPIQRSE